MLLLVCTINCDVIHSNWIISFLSIRCCVPDFASRLEVWVLNYRVFIGKSRTKELLMQLLRVYCRDGVLKYTCSMCCLAVAYAVYLNFQQRCSQLYITLFQCPLLKEGNSQVQILLLYSRFWFHTLPYLATQSIFQCRPWNSMSNMS